jgi:hypothetical protein
VGKRLFYFPPRVFLLKYSNEGMKGADKDTRTRTKPEAARDVAWDIKKKYGSCNEERKTNG